jgi:hypothetical protein
MVRRRLHTALALAPILAIATQILLPALAAAATGGGDFPGLRWLPTVR